ncbi:hypothetical protein [Desulfosporosinus hippei]|nr:hypothetical protein [Desulfosporosinus hippei]
MARQDLWRVRKEACPSRSERITLRGGNALKASSDGAAEAA